MSEKAAHYTANGVPPADDIAIQLDRWQETMAGMDKQSEALYAVTGFNDGPLFNAFIDLQTEYTRLLADRIDFDFATLEDWWVAHGFGAEPMYIGLRGQGMGAVSNNAELAAFIRLYQEQEAGHESP